MHLAQRTDAFSDVDAPALAFADLAEIPEQGDGRLIVARSLGGNERLDTPPGVGLPPKREASRPLLPQHARHCPVLEAGSALGFMVYPPLEPKESVYVEYEGDGRYKFVYYLLTQDGKRTPIFQVTMVMSVGGVGMMKEEVSFVGAPMLSREADLQIVGTAEDFDGLVQGAEAAAPHVIVSDIRMPPNFQQEGIDACKAIRKRHPGIGIVILSQYDDPDYAITLLSEGAAVSLAIFPVLLLVVIIQLLYIRRVETV